MLIAKPMYRAVPARQCQPATQANTHTATRTVAANIFETPDAYGIELLAPGLEKADFQVRIERDILTVAVEKAPQAPEGIKMLRREFGAHSFERRFRLPHTVDAAAIGGRYDNGILTLTLPKREEAKDKGPATIAVQ